MVLFEPGIGTLEALEREFSQRIRPLLRAASRGGDDRAFSQASEGGEKSLYSLALRIGELRVKLGMEQTFRDTLAGGYSLACLRWRYGDPPANSKPADENTPCSMPTAKQLADELLSLAVHDDS